jgi:putative membrane protein
MKVLSGMGKLLIAVFWLLVLINLATRLPDPFGMLINLTGAAVALIHFAEVLMFNGRLRGRRRPWRDRLQILLFGAFHLLSLPKRSPESAHA